MGDLNGIGLEVVLKSFSNQDLLRDITPVVYSSMGACEFYKQLLSLDSINFHSIDSMGNIKDNVINVMNVWKEDVKIEPGVPTKISGQKALQSLQVAVDDLVNNRIDVLVTAPIDKNNIQSKDFKFPGHTEFLAKTAGVEEALMFLVADNLRVGVLTGHIPLCEVANNVTQQKIIAKLSQMHKSLKGDFGIKQPKIAVLGLNPHAGDNGLIGKEDIEIIVPAIEEANIQGMATFGPFASDGLFGSLAYKKYDGILAMYHDQGLIPFKVLAFDTGVNFTAGLPFVRTSPDHGTAFDIAGKNLASPTSFRNAVYLAIKVFNTRKIVFEDS